MAPQPPKILAFAGSTRTESWNKKLVKIAAQGAQDAGAIVTVVDLRDFPMPLYDGDLEDQQGLPETVQQFKALMLDHQGLLIAAPEYNSSITGVLKNIIDWASRQAEGEASLACFTGKVASLMSASPGGLGGLRGLVHVRAILESIGVIVLPNQVAVSKVHEAFSPEGRLFSEKQQSSILTLGKQTADILKKLQS